MNQLCCCLVTYVCIYPFLGPPSHLTLSHPSRSSQSSELSSLCYTTGSHELSILHMIVYIYQSQSHCHFYLSSVQFSSVPQSRLTLYDPMNYSMPGLPCPLPAPGVYPNPCPSSRWCHPAISSSVVPFSSCPKLLPASGSFQMSQLFAWGGPSIGVSASTSVPPMNSQEWSPLGWTGWISLQSQGLSRVFSNTTVQKHQFFSQLRF